MQTRRATKQVVLDRPFGTPLVKLRFDASKGKSAGVEPPQRKGPGVGARAPKRRHTPSLSTFPAQDVVDGLIAIARAELERKQAVNVKRGPLRAVGNALLHLGVISKEVSACLRADPLYLPLCAFLNALLRKAGEHFLDGIPPTISLFHGEHGERNLNGQNARCYFAIHPTAPSLTLRAALADRQTSAAMICADKLDTTNAFSKYHIGDEGRNLSVRIAWFLGRARMMAKGLAVHRRGDEFDNCVVCGNRCFTGTMTAGDEDDENGAQLVIDENTSASYWQVLGGVYPTAASSIGGTLCCSACERATTRDIEKAAGVRAVELEEFDASPDKSGTSRVSSALREAVKRNQLVARRLRCGIPSCKHLNPDQVTEIRRKTIRALNIDLGLLVACASVCETAAGRCRAQPPTFLLWRCNQLVYASAASNVSSLYSRYAAGKEQVLEHPSENCKFLQKCRELAAVLVRSF